MRTFPTALIGGFCLLSLASCIDKEGRIRSNLVELGFSDSSARCMAKPMAADLSVGQLQKLGALAKAMRNADRPNGMQGVLDRMVGIGDPEIIGVVGKATLGCMFSG